jgi:ferrous iron transport protein A
MGSKGLYFFVDKESHYRHGSVVKLAQTEAAMNLARLKPGQKGKITAIGAIGPLKRRLMDMGVLVGEEVKVVKVAPLGDPIEVTIKSYQLSLRKKEAEGIAVEVLA